MPQGDERRSAQSALIRLLGGTPSRAMLRIGMDGARDCRGGARITGWMIDAVWGPANGAETRRLHGHVFLVYLLFEA
jgi:hypothetical protein